MYMLNTRDMDYHSFLFSIFQAKRLVQEIQIMISSGKGMQHAVLIVRDRHITCFLKRFQDHSQPLLSVYPPLYIVSIRYKVTAYT